MIIVAPKTLLRLSSAVSSFQDMSPGSSFRNVIGDGLVDPERVTKVVLCSGKHYYNLMDQRKSLGVDDVALVRLESLCPFPTKDILEEIGKYSKAKGKERERG